VGSDLPYGLRAVRAPADNPLMYDVIYIDAQGAETSLAEHLTDRQDAAQLACKAAAERKAGRMVLPGSNKLPNCVCVVPTDKLESAA
jgi:hypothetical protein